MISFILLGHTEGCLFWCTLARAPPVHAVIADNGLATHFGRRLFGGAQHKLAARVALFAFAIANRIVALAVGNALRGGWALEIRLA
jgi:hypothetical protein